MWVYRATVLASTLGLRVLAIQFIGTRVEADGMDWVDSLSSFIQGIHEQE